MLWCLYSNIYTYMGIVSVFFLLESQTICLSSYPGIPLRAGLVFTLLQHLASEMIFFSPHAQGKITSKCLMAYFVIIFCCLGV